MVEHHTRIIAELKKERERFPEHFEGMRDKIRLVEPI